MVTTSDALHSRAVMNFVAGLVLQILLLGAPCAPAHAQAEFLGETFPYKAFSTLPTTPIAIGGARSMSDLLRAN